MALVLFVPLYLRAGDDKSAQAPEPGTLTTDTKTSGQEKQGKRIFFIIPNYRTVPTARDFKPLKNTEKFKIAFQDSFDPGTFVLAGAFAGEAQLTNANRSFGQGASGYAKYYGASFADWAIADYMTEGIFPVLLHQDPRYFRSGTGSSSSRLIYAVRQIFITRADSGNAQFNYSEFVGNSAAVAISNLYYEDHRTASNAISKVSTQIGVDLASNILKEFWPDFQRKFQRKPHPDSNASVVR